MRAVAAREGGGGSGSAGQSLPPQAATGAVVLAHDRFSGAGSERLPPEGDADSPCAGRESLGVPRRHLDDSGER